MVKKLSEENEGRENKASVEPGLGSPITSFSLPNLNTRAILDTMVDGVVIVDDAGIIKMFNRAAEKLFGYKDEEVFGKNVKILMPPGYRDLHDGYVSRAVSEKRRDNLVTARELEGQRKDGTTFPMELSLGHGGAADQVFFIGVIRDITDRKRTEATMLDHQEELMAVIETAVDGIIIIDSLGTVRNYNAACENIFGFNKSETIGNNVRMLMPSPHFDKHNQYIADYISSGNAKVIGIGREVTGRRKNGETFPMELSVGRIDHRNSLSFVGIIRDITDRKLAEETLIKSAEQAEKANQAKSEFLSRASHELRTPLNAIMGFSEMILSKTMGPLPDTYSSYANDIHISAKDLLKLVNDMLDLSRLQGNNITLNKEITSIEKIMRNALKGIRGDSGKFGNTIVRFQVDDALPRVLVDPRLISQVIVNLVNNAIEAQGDQGGGITLMATQVTNGDMCVSVVDDGPGISNGRLQTIFEPFSQSEAFLASERTGKGLGLSICQGIVQLHGGNIWIESMVRKGTKASFTIPASLVLNSD
jgi:PAS domain S-box-containing protein